MMFVVGMLVMLLIVLNAVLLVACATMRDEQQRHAKRLDAVDAFVAETRAQLLRYAPVVSVKPAVKP